jgi:hypothetical protein
MEYVKKSFHTKFVEVDEILTIIVTTARAYERVRYERGCLALYP